MTAGLLTPDGRAGAWAGGTIDVELGHGENAHDSNKFTIIYNVKHDRFLQHDRFLSWYLWGPVWRVVNAVAPIPRIKDYYYNGTILYDSSKSR